MRKSFILYCIFTMICTAACRLYAQPQPFVTLKWEDYPVTRMENFEEVTRDYFFEGAEFNDSGLPVCVQSIDIGRNCTSAQYDITLEFPEYEPVSFWQNKRLTEERRKQLVKQARSEGEDAKISVRNARRDAIEQIKKLVKDGLPEDVGKDTEAEVQKIHDKYIKKVDEMLAEKEKEIMTV